MTAEDAEERDAGRAQIALLVGDDATRPPAQVTALRAAAIEALNALEIPLVLTTLANLAHYLERIGSEARILVFADSPSVLAMARETIGRERDTAFCLFISPTSFAEWGKFSDEWSAGLVASAGGTTVHLTDSTLSRAVVENQLRATRADVRVLVPQVAEGAATDAFAEMKSWRPGAKISRYSGVDWDFSPRVEALPDAPRQPRSEETIAENRDVIHRILDGRRLDGEPVHIGILGHKLSFIDELGRDLGRRTGSTVELDEWKNLGAPSDVRQSQRVMARSDVVIGEWGRPNNVWIQNHASPDKRLIVRVHRYEVTTDFPYAIDMDRFDAAVVIVPWVGRALVQKFGWPAEKIVYIPNYVNADYFRRPKLPGAEHTLGIVGITPDLKRLDLALDLLAALRAQDLRYALRVRGQLPTAHVHWSTNPLIPEQWGKILFRLRTDPLLRNAVSFDEPGRDMAAWLEGIGVILSMSDLEGSHVALAEGAASGALPIARPWPGIRTLWPSDFIFDDMDAAVQQVLRARDREWREENIAQVSAHPSLDPDRVLQAWWDLVRGDRDSAQHAFGPVNWSADWYEPVEM